MLYRRLDKPLFLFCLLIGLVPLLGTYMSYMRYVMPAFGLYIAYAGWLSTRSLALAIGIVLSMALLQSLFISLQVVNHWVA